MKLTDIFCSVKHTAIKHAPEIMTGIGIAGMIATTVLAVKATPKALNDIEEKKREINKDLREDSDVHEKVTRLEPIDVVKTTWKTYLPAAITGCMSAGFLIGASKVNAKRNAVLATAYALSEKTISEYSEYKKKVIEEIGSEKEQVVKDKVAQEVINNDPPKNTEVLMPVEGKILCYDYISGRYFHSTKSEIERVVNEINARLIGGEEYVSLNDLYYELHLKSIKMGDMLGWNVGMGIIDVQFSSAISENGIPCLVMDFACAPRYDYAHLM